MSQLPIHRTPIHRSESDTRSGDFTPSPGLFVAGLFVVGTDTEVGKTYVSVRIVQSLVDAGVRTGVYKPAASGVVADQPSDGELLYAAAQLVCDPARVCPQSFVAAVAPPIAAQLQQRTIDEDLLLSGALWWNSNCQFLLVEGAGGVLSPLSFQTTVADLAQRLQLPTLLVAANRLGVVNQTLLSLDALKARGLEVEAVFLNTPSRRSDSAIEDASLDSNALLLSQFTDVPIVSDIDELPTRILRKLEPGL